MTDREAMNRAINFARENQTPYGSCVKDDASGTFLITANSTKTDGKTAHAEMNALRRLPHLQNYNPATLTLFSTAEPCPMCMSAIIWCGISKVVYGIGIDYIKEYHNQILIPAEDVIKNSWLEVNIRPAFMLEETKALFKLFQ